MQSTCIVIAFIINKSCINPINYWDHTDSTKCHEKLIDSLINILANIVIRTSIVYILHFLILTTRHSDNVQQTGAWKWGRGRVWINQWDRPACAAKCKAELPSLSGLLTSMPGRWRNSSRKFVRFVEQMYDKAVYKVEHKSNNKLKINWIKCLQRMLFNSFYSMRWIDLIGDMINCIRASLFYANPIKLRVTRSLNEM